MFIYTNKVTEVLLKKVLTDFASSGYKAFAMRFFTIVHSVLLIGVKKSFSEYF